MNYNWQQSDWTKFSYNLHDVEGALYDFVEKSGRINGALKAMSKQEYTQTLINILVAEAIKTSEIEGEYLSRKDVASSIRNNLGFNIHPESVKDKRAKGMADLITDIQNNYTRKLNKETLFT